MFAATGCKEDRWFSLYYTIITTTTATTTTTTPTTYCKVYS